MPENDIKDFRAKYGDNIRPQRGLVSEGIRSVGEAGKDIGDKLFGFGKDIGDNTTEKTMKESNDTTNNKKTDKTSNKTQHNKTPSSLDDSSILQNIVLIVFAVGLAVMWYSAVVLEKIADEESN